MAERSDADGPGSRARGDASRYSIFTDRDRGQSRRDHPQSWGEVNTTDTDWPGEDAEDDSHAPYREWRARQIEDYDRDYAEFRREKQREFETDFARWRDRRQNGAVATGGERGETETARAPDRSATAGTTGPAGEEEARPRARGARAKG